MCFLMKKEKLLELVGQCLDLSFCIIWLGKCSFYQGEVVEIKSGNCEM